MKAARTASARDPSTSNRSSRRIKASIDAVPAIDTHEHLQAFGNLPGRVETPDGPGMTLHSIWAGGYFGWTSPLAPWPADGKFDTVNAEGIYAATEFTRQCLAEALAEKVARGELREEHALRIGRQIVRDNALKLFPKLHRMLWREES